MNTTGIQNYLSNVFRPIYTYDSTTFNFTPRLELSNIDNYSGNTVSVFTAAVGDSNNNVYVGSNAGNPYNITRGCRSITALGVGAANNISNDISSIYIGYYAGSAGSNSSNVISIGTNSGGNGNTNIFLGSSTGTVGASNILIGHGIVPGNVSDQIRIGVNNQIPIAADLSKNWVGLGGPLGPTANNKLDISGDTQIQGRLGINITPDQRTFEVNGDFRARDASTNILDFANGFTTSSGGFGSIQSNAFVNAAATPIGTLKKGAVLVSAVDQSDNTNYASRMVFAYTLSNIVNLGFDVSGGDATIDFDTSNIRIVDTTSAKTYDYSITYFPLP